MAELGLPSAALAGANDQRRRRALVEGVAAWGLAGPATFLMALLLFLPTFAVVLISLTDWQLGASAIRWVGLTNYHHLFADRVFWQSLGNTLIYVGITVSASVVLGLG